jgi:hypothetical protein
MVASVGLAAASENIIDASTWWWATGDKMDRRLLLRSVADRLLAVNAYSRIILARPRARKSPAICVGMNTGARSGELLRNAYSEEGRAVTTEAMALISAV